MNREQMEVHIALRGGFFGSSGHVLLPLALVFPCGICSKDDKDKYSHLVFTEPEPYGHWQPFRVDTPPSDVDFWNLVSLAQKEGWL